MDGTAARRAGSGLVRQGSSRATATEAWLMWECRPRLPALAHHLGADHLTPLITGLQPRKCESSDCSLCTKDQISLDQAGGRAWGPWRPSVCAGTPNGTSRRGGRQAGRQAGTQASAQSTAAETHQAVCSDLRSSSPALMERE